MSSNESLTQSDANPSEQAITIQPSSVTAYSGLGDWVPAGGNEPAQESAINLAALHAVRRHWLVILSTGLACATVTAAILSPATDPWLGLKAHYKATALLELKPSSPVILSNAADQGQRVGNEFEIFRDTQQGLIKSELVITPALRDPKLKGKPCVQEQDDNHNAVAWLIGEIHVDFGTKNTGIMEVSALEPIAKDAADIVNAVVGAYRAKVVDNERQGRRDRLNELAQIHDKKDAEVREKRNQLKRELEAINAGDDEQVRARGQMAVQMYAEFQREFQRMRSEHRILLGKLQDAKKAREEQMADLEYRLIPRTEVVMLLNTNPMYRDLQTRVAMLEQLQQIHNNASAGTLAKEPPTVVRTRADYNFAKGQLDNLVAESSKMVHDARLIQLDQDIRRLDSQLLISTDALAAFEKEVEKKANEADNVSRGTVNIQMERAEVENIERMLRGVAEEKERLLVELNAPDRVVVLGNATPPEGETGKMLRYLKILFFSALAMLVPGVGIVVWDLRKERVNCVNDVSKRLKLPVIGTVPRIPVTVMRRLGDTARKSQIWKMRFTESVDGVAARLLRKAECDQARVILITSAMGGEGKTTLATQLAMSLARVQRRVVLVDFDLRQPTLAGALGLPPGPGICEALRGQVEIMDTVRQTETERLSVVAAGAWNRQVLADLSSGAVATVLAQLRVNFDFVIIDSSPLLPIVDTRLLCQHVDAVVLSVFRDISQGSKVQAAQEMLDAFGVRSVETVVIGGEEHTGAKSLAYQTAILDEQVVPAENKA